MPILFIGLVVVFLVLAALVWATFNFFGLIVTLVVAGLVGWLADTIVPGDLPFGWLGAIVAGLLGAWLGGLILGDLGPDIGGIAIIPAVLGAIIVAFLVDWLAKLGRGRRTV